MFLQGVSDPAVLWILLGISYISCTGLSPPMVGLSKPVPLHNLSPYRSPNPPLAVTNWVWAVSRSLATTCEITVVFFSSAYLDVSVQRVHLPCGMTNLQLAGLPHSEISGSMCICHSPKLIAAYHVFHRLQEPRHPPYALNYFLFSWTNYGPTYLYSLLQPQMSEEALSRVIYC